MNVAEELKYKKFLEKNPLPELNREYINSEEYHEAVQSEVEGDGNKESSKHYQAKND